MNPPFAMSGTTAMHLAAFSTSSGMPLSGAPMISCRTTPADCRRAVLSSTPDPANAKGARDNVSNAITSFFIKHFLFIPPCFCGPTCERRLPPLGSDCSAATDQVDDQNHDGNDQQNVDQTACYVETETEQPQNQENYKNRPKHELLLRLLRGFEVV